MCANIWELYYIDFGGRTKRRALLSVHFVWSWPIKTPCSLTVKKGLSLIFGKPIKVCRSFHIGGRIGNKCYILPSSPLNWPIMELWKKKSVCGSLYPFSFLSTFPLFSPLSTLFMFSFGFFNSSFLVFFFFWRNRGGSLMSKSKPRALRKLAKCNTAAIQHDARKWGWGAESLSPVFPGPATAPGLGFDLFKASCLLLDGESWLLLANAGEKQRGSGGGW